jgi:hypothetical protein
MNHATGEYLTAQEYQRALDAAFADVNLVNRVRAAARDLAEHGYAVVEGVVDDPALLQWAHARFWASLGQAVPAGSHFAGWTRGPPTGPEDLKAFRSTHDWPPNKHGIIENPEIAHLDFVHALRLHPRVMAVFALLYGAQGGLVVAPDRFNYQLPREWLPRMGTKLTADDLQRWKDTVRAQDPILGCAEEASWLHHDQALTKAGLHCVQGLVTVLPADQPGDASLEVVAGSHQWHAQLEHLLGVQLDAQARRRNWYMLSDADKAKLDLRTFGQVRCGAGALVLWDSRALHQGGIIRAIPRTLERPVDPGRARFVVYVCAQPAVLGLTRAQVEKKQRIFAEHTSTSHWPLESIVFGKPRQYRANQPEFHWPVAPAPHAGTAAEELYGLVGAQRLRFGVPADTPLLAFAPESGMCPPQGVKRARDD